MTYQIKYGKGRFPIRQKREDGTYGCRGCGGDIPKNRQTWCSRGCAGRFHPSQVIASVERRDKGVCQLCGFDCAAAKREWRKAVMDLGYSYEPCIAPMKVPRPPRAEYDHIIPFSEGGMTVLENMRTLCSLCHRKVTAEFAAKRAAGRRRAGGTCGETLTIDLQ